MTPEQELREGVFEALLNPHNAWNVRLKPPKRERVSKTASFKAFATRAKRTKSQHVQSIAELDKFYDRETNPLMPKLHSKKENQPPPEYDDRDPYEVGLFLGLLYRMSDSELRAEILEIVHSD